MFLFRSHVKECLHRARTLPVHSGETVKEGRDGQNVLPVMDADGGGGQQNTAEPRAACDSIWSRPNSSVVSVKHD